MNPDHARNQTRTADTIKLYLKRAHGILSKIAAEMQLHEDAYPAPDDVVAYMQRNANKWKWATFRQYQASIACRYEVRYEETRDPLYQRAAEEIRKLPWTDCKKASDPGSTSSLKRKGVPKRDYEVLVAKLWNPIRHGDFSKRAALWLMASMCTGLRPCEWEHASLSGDGTSVTANNAKATNGRGTGVSRTVPISAEDASVVRAHLESLAEMKAKGITFDQMHERCSVALRRACRSIWGNDPKRRYALYSARHQFAANAKATKSHEEVAELLGHSSVRTARRHYAKRRSAWLEFKEASRPANTPETTPRPNN